VANRRISEFPSIDGTQIDEQDLLTLVHVFEVDPTLRNKKITFTQFRQYLDQYYANITGEIIYGNVTIAGNLTVTGTSNFTTITGSSLATFSGVVVQNNLTTSGTVSGNTITGDTGLFGNLTAISGTFTDRISGATITGNTIQGSNISGVSGVFTTQVSGATITGNVVKATSVTGVSGVFTTQLSGETVTGTTARFTSGVFENITAANQFFTSGTISGNLFVLGSGYFTSGINITGVVSGTTITGTLASFTTFTGQTAGFTTVTGTTVTGTTANFVTVSGATVTGNTGLFTDITGSTLHITTPSGGTPAIVCSGVVSGDANGFVIQGPLVILP